MVAARNVLPCESSAVPPLRRFNKDCVRLTIGSWTPRGAKHVGAPEGTGPPANRSCSSAGCPGSSNHSGQTSITGQPSSGKPGRSEGATKTIEQQLRWSCRGGAKQATRNRLLRDDLRQHNRRRRQRRGFCDDRLSQHLPPPQSLHTRSNLRPMKCLSQARHDRRRGSSSTRRLTCNHSRSIRNATANAAVRSG